MKILQLAERFFPEYLGTSVRIYNLSLDKRNDHYIYVPFPEFLSNTKAKEKIKNLLIIRYKIPNFNLRNHPNINFLINYNFNFQLRAMKLLKIIKEKDFNIVHAHSPILYGICGMKYAKKKKLPLIYETHFFSSDIPIIKTKKYIPNFIYSSFNVHKIRKEKIIFNYADRIIAQTKFIKNRMVKFFNICEDKIIVIPMGVDENLFNPTKFNKKREEIRRYYEWEDKIVFLYNGYLDTINGIDLFLNSIKDLPENNKKLMKIIILGRGPLKNLIEKFAKKKPNMINYHGLINYLEMPKYYSACDVVVNPRQDFFLARDNVPTKMLEAMAMEKLILASNINAIKDIVIDNYNGILFKSGNKIDLMKKLNYIFNNFKDFDKIRKEARKTVVENYSWKDMREKLQGIYNFLSLK